MVATRKAPIRVPANSACVLPVERLQVEAVASDVVRREQDRERSQADPEWP